MPENMNPYDTGDRLEPKPWPVDSAAGADPFGRVDFNNEFDETVITAWVQKMEAGYIMRVDEHQDVQLTIETSSQRAVRKNAMMRFDEVLRTVTAQHSEAVELHEGDPEAFAPGHYVIETTAQDQRLVINEQYIGTDSSNEDRIPNSWTVDVEHRTLENGRTAWQLIESREINAEHVDSFSGLVTDWVHTQAWQRATVDALHNTPSQSRHQHGDTIVDKGAGTDIPYAP